MLITSHDGPSAFAAYQEIRARLPKPGPPGAAIRAPDLGAVAEPFDLILLDAYGVLNVGERPVRGAVARMAALRAAGKRLCVVTNSAGYPKRLMMERHARLGFDFAPDEVASSREALLAHLSGDTRQWGAMLSPEHGVEDIGGLSLRFLGDDPADYAAVDGFLMIGSAGWNARRQALLEAALLQDPRPVLVGNPDLVAPREDGLSLEPGHYAHHLADSTGCVPRFFGKPFPEIFDIALSRLASRPDPARVLMVGDTLQTDVLGAQALGFKTALVMGHGMLKGMDCATACAVSGIYPDFILEHT